MAESNPPESGNIQQVTSAEVTYRQTGSFARVTIEREAQRNTLSPQTIEALTASLNRAELDPGVRVVIVTGAGTKAFCAGADFSSMAQNGFLDGHESRRHYPKLLLRLQSMRKPTLARINGHALAGGLGLVLACDLAVMADDCQLGTPEVDRGLFPMVVSSLLQRHVGRKRSLSLLLTGQRISAAQAVEWGLVNEAVARAELDTRVDALAHMLASKSQAVLALGRRAFFSAEDLPLEAAMEMLVAQLSLNVTAEDAAEGVTAFLEKRTPRWSDR
jgi:enoyl-CoA hydratase